MVRPKHNDGAGLFLHQRIVVAAAQLGAGGTAATKPTARAPLADQNALPVPDGAGRYLLQTVVPLRLRPKYELPDDPSAIAPTHAVALVALAAAAAAALRGALRSGAFLYLVVGSSMVRVSATGVVESIFGSVPGEANVTMARDNATLAQAPRACTTRQPIMARALPERAQPAEPITNSTNPTATEERRPYRSLIGPQSSCPKLKPRR